MAKHWRDCIEAGQELGNALLSYSGEDTVVYGLPRGGAIVAAEVARVLGGELGLVIARKIGHPGHAEYAIGAVTETGRPVLNETEAPSVNQEWLEKEIDRQRKEAKRRRILYLEDYHAPEPAGKAAIIVDDGIATGYTMRAAINELRQKSAAQIIVAAPVAPQDAVADIMAEADEVVVLHVEKGWFGAVGRYYDYFEQVEDEEVVGALHDF